MILTYIFVSCLNRTKYKALRPKINCFVTGYSCLLTRVSHDLVDIWSKAF